MDLAETVALMRSLGVTEYVAPDGSRVVLGAEPMRPLGALPSLGAPDLDADRDADARAKAAHYKRWALITAASGAPIPDYVPRG